MRAQKWNKNNHPEVWKLRGLSTSWRVLPFGRWEAGVVLCTNFPIIKIMYAPCTIQGPSRKHTQLEFWRKGLFTEDWSGLINEQEIAKHAGPAILGSCYHPYSWRGKGKSWSGDTSQELLWERAHLPPDWGTGWAQLEVVGQKALGDVCTKVSPQRNTEQHSKGKKKLLGWKEDGRTKGKSSIIITEHCKEQKF